MQQFQPMKNLKIPSKSKIRGCRLKSIFKAQNSLLQLYSFYKGESPQNLTQMYVLAILSELGELLDQINWKSWKNNKRTIDKKELQYEIIDIFTFSLSLMLAWGMNENDCWQYFMAKNKENLNRIKRGY